MMHKMKFKKSIPFTQHNRHCFLLSRLILWAYSTGDCYIWVSWMLIRPHMAFGSHSEHLPTHWIFLCSSVFFCSHVFTSNFHVGVVTTVDNGSFVVTSAIQLLCRLVSPVTVSSQSVTEYFGLVTARHKSVYL